MSRVVALIGAAAITLGLLEAVSAGAAGNGEIAVVSSGGVAGFSAIELIPSDRLATASTSKLLAAGKGSFYDLQWTPDGKTLVYAQESGKPTRENIYAVDVPSLRRRLLAANVVGGHPEVLSPDGKTVAYTLDNNGKSGVYLVGIDGRSRRHLIDGGSGSPTWSPDSKRLAIVKDSNSVVTIGTDGKGTRRVRLGGSRLNTVMSIGWGPAGTSLLAETFDSNTFADRIELVALDGHVLHTLTSTAFPSFTSTWSPRGTQIAFVERRGAKQYVVVVHADGSGRHTIESIGRETSQISLAWSPDGRSVVTAHERSVRVVQANGTRARVIANAGGTATLDDPAWQPRP